MNDIKFTNKNINKTNFANIDIAASLKCHSPMNNVINQELISSYLRLIT